MNRAAAFVLVGTIACAAPREQVTPSPMPLPTPTTSATTPRPRDYDDELGDFLRGRWTIPAHAHELCVVFQVNVSPRMIIWHVRGEPVHASGDTTFDDSVRLLLQKLLDDHVPLPEPPDDLADKVRGHTVNLALGTRQLGPLAGECR